MENASNALLLKDGEYRHKIKVLLKLAEWFEEMEEERLAFMHYQFVYDIRQQNGWTILPSLQSKITQFQEKISLQANYKSELTKLWKSYALAPLPKTERKITKILPRGNAGFIEMNNGKVIYFQMRNCKGKVGVNQRVSFYMKRSWNHKKNELSFEAIEVKKT